MRVFGPLMSMMGIRMHTLSVMQRFHVCKLRPVILCASKINTRGIRVYYTRHTPEMLILGLGSFRFWAIGCWVSYERGKVVFYPLEGLSMAWTLDFGKLP